MKHKIIWRKRELLLEKETMGIVDYLLGDENSWDEDRYTEYLYCGNALNAHDLLEEVMGEIYGVVNNDVSLVSEIKKYENIYNQWMFFYGARV